MSLVKQGIPVRGRAHLEQDVQRLKDAADPKPEQEAAQEAVKVRRRVVLGLRAALPCIGK